MKRILIIALVVLAAGVSAYFGARAVSSPGAVEERKTNTAAQVWTCSMHPQVRKPGPGKCPICGMPLVPTSQAPESGSESGAMLKLSEHARAMASVETVAIARRELNKEIRSVGKIQYNERGLATVVSRVDGFIERLFVDSTGVKVNQGDHLVEIYSQDLAVAMNEMLIFKNYADNPGNVEAARNKLRQWSVGDDQIAEVLKTGKPLPRITLRAPVAGTVVERLVVEGSHVNRGDTLYRLASLDSVWVYLDIYEYELSWVQLGQSVEITTEAYPGRKFEGMVTFINPALNEDTRTVKVRVNLGNRERLFKPGMFVHAAIRTRLLADGRPAPTGLEGKFTCAMHSEIIRERAGKCPVCGMDLEQVPERAASATESDLGALAVPAAAVLDTGLRKLVYLEKTPGEYLPAEITVGPRAGEYFPVLKGLKEGDRVVTRGNFLIDSQFQIQGLPSLFQRAGETAPPTGHQHASPPEHKH